MTWGSGIVRDAYQYRVAISMGYEIIQGRMWWPEYDDSKWDRDDWYKGKVPYGLDAAIKNQRERIGVAMYSSPDRKSLMLKRVRKQRGR